MGKTKGDDEEDAILRSMEEPCPHYVDRNRLDITDFIYLGSGYGEFEIVCTHCGEIGSLRCWLQVLPTWGGQITFSLVGSLKERTINNGI